MLDGTLDDPIPKPFLRWAGSKKQLLGRIVERIPEQFNQYIEPFSGSACVFFKLKPETAVLGDANVELMETYSTIARNPRRVYKIYQSFGPPEESYYTIRANVEKKGGRFWAAARFLYLNRYCFNGIYRTNRNGEFNVPLGSRYGEFPTLEEFIASAKLLRNAKMVAGDFSLTVRSVKKGDFVYLDPPYASKGKKDRNEYGNGSFSPKDIPRLLKALERIHKKGATFLISYSTAEDFLEKLPRPVKQFIEARRTVASDPKKRGIALEVLLGNVDMFGEESARK